jgi:hypothetical protein
MRTQAIVIAALFAATSAYRLTHTFAAGMNEDEVDNTHILTQ